MAHIQLQAPPVPYYIMGSPLSYPAGRGHPSRRSIGLFDLLVVRKGCLYIGEDGQAFEVGADHALILRPDGSHYATQDCVEETSYYWVHFNTSGSWSMQSGDILPDTCCCHSTCGDAFAAQPFTISLPQFARLRQPALFFEELERLTELEVTAHMKGVSWEQQQIFQKLLRLLSASAATAGSTPSMLCAQQAASYLRANYRNEIKAQAAYFSTCFHKYEGVAPRSYRSRFT
jgi:hypothetical protein